jgi:hypothetical protein
MPIELSAITIASVIRTMRISFESRTWIDGVRSVKFWTRLSRKLEKLFASHRVISSSAVVLSTSSGVSRSPPSLSVTAGASSVSVSG